MRVGCNKICGTDVSAIQRNSIIKIFTILLVIYQKIINFTPPKMGFATIARGMKGFILLIFTLIAGTSASYAQNKEHFRIRYVINRPEVDTTFVDNTARISDMRAFLEGLRNDPLTRVTSVRFAGTASPDGAYDFNVWLSENRLRTFKELVYSYIDIPDSLILANTSDIPWDGFREKVAASDIAHRDEVLAIIDEGPSLVPWFNNRRIDPRLLKLKKLYGGSVWNELKSPILRDLRYGDAEFEYYRMQPSSTPPRIVFGDLALVETPLALRPEPLRKWMPHIYLKTNFIGLGMLMANLACELDIAPHWSFTLPIYY